MSRLFEDLKEGLQEAIAFAKGEGEAKVTNFETATHHSDASTQNGDPLLKEDR